VTDTTLAAAAPVFVPSIHLAAARFVLLVNAAAGTGLAPRRLDALLARVPAVGARSRVVATRTLDDLAQTVAALAPDEIPVAVGGDGSLNALLVALMRRDALHRVVGIVPFGTGNATAATLGLRSADAAMRALGEGRVHALDVMRTSHPRAPLALVSCSAGFEAAFLARYGAVRYRSRQWAGWSALLGNLPRRWRDITLVADGHDLVRAGESVHNAGCYVIPTYAYGKVMWPGLRADDGLGIAAAARDVGAYWTLIARGFPLPPAGTQPTLLGTRARRWTAAHLESPTGLQVDGEALGPGTVELRIEPSAVRVIGA
jgi:diacylglycerol kinase family enzyme